MDKSTQNLIKVVCVIIIVVFTGIVGSFATYAYMQYRYSQDAKEAFKHTDEEFGH